MATNGRSWADQVEEEDTQKEQQAATAHDSVDDAPPPGFERAAPGKQQPVDGTAAAADAAEEAVAVAQLAGVTVTEEPAVDEPDLSLKSGRLVDEGPSEIKTVTAGESVYSSAKTFEELGLSQELLQGLYTEMKFERPSRIQAGAGAGGGSPRGNLMVLERMGKYAGITATSTAAADYALSRRSRIEEQVVVGTHGKLRDWMNKRVLATKDGTTKILISTDVLSRGFDVSQVTLVINFDVPTERDLRTPAFETYLHRIGRSGRFGRKGAAFNLITGTAERRVIDEISAYFKHDIPEVPFDDEDRFVDVLRKAGLTGDD
eukprot:scaffold30.g4464.t1